VVEARHEGAAVAMAEGHGWSRDGVGFATVTHGPGLTHAATSLVAAGRNHSPLVLLLAETPARYGGAQEFDQASFVGVCEAAYRRLEPGEDPAAVLDEVTGLALTRPGPVVLGVASDLLASPAPTGAGHPGQRPARTDDAARGDDAAAAREVEQALARATRPVIVAGRGAIGGATAAALMAVADRFGAALATTLRAKGLFDGHRYNLGIAGGLSHPAAERVLKCADLVVAVGASMSRSTTQSMRLFPDADVVMVTDEPPGGPRPRFTRLQADAAGTSSLLAASITGNGASRTAWFTPPGPPARCWQRDLVDYAPPVEAGAVDPRRALAVLSGLLPDGAIIVVSNGHSFGFPSVFVDVPPRGRFFTAQGFGSIGQAFPSAVGVALGAPNRKVVVFEGDASFMMHASEIETAARAGADVTVFVLNDEALGAEYQRLAAHDGAHAGLAVVPPPSLAPVASAFGARGYAVSSEDQFAVAAPEALAPGLALVDVRIARSVISPHMRTARAASGRQAQGRR
jgi:thiamine pyrophosphate-dependent acetolactate synthase large subunit-like protein